VRILFVIRDLDIGGAQRQAINLARMLTGRGHSVAILAFYPGGRLGEALANCGVRIFKGIKRGRWDMWSPFLDIRRAVGAFKPDCVYSFLALANICVGIGRLLTVCPRWLFGYRHSEMELGQYSWLSGVMYKAEALLSRKADWIIANSHAGARNAARWGINPERIRVIPNGIETDYFQPSLSARERMRRQWGIPDGMALIGLVGRIDPMKDHVNFVTAASRLRESNPNVRFVCIGDGPDEAVEKLKELSRTLGIADAVLWPGSQADMAGAYNALDVLCLPSAFGEGFPNVVGEAMACGVPCVVSDVGDSALIVGDLGRVVPPRNAAALALALSCALGARSANLAQACRRRIENEFNMERFVARTENLMCCAGGPGKG
jgi:glycosyltransferase involved in cell wall biosynthesis